MCRAYIDSITMEIMETDDYKEQVLVYSYEIISIALIYAGRINRDVNSSRSSGGGGSFSGGAGGGMR